MFVLVLLLIFRIMFNPILKLIKNNSNDQISIRSNTQIKYHNITNVVYRTNKILYDTSLYKSITNNVVWHYLIKIIVYIFLIFSSNCVNVYENINDYKWKHKNMCNKHFNDWCYWNRIIDCDTLSQQLNVTIDGFIDNYINNNNYFSQFTNYISDYPNNINWIAYKNRIIIWVISDNYYPHILNQYVYDRRRYAYIPVSSGVYNGNIFYFDITIIHVKDFYDKNILEYYEFNTNMSLFEFKYYGNMYPDICHKTISQYMIDNVMDYISIKF